MNAELEARRRADRHVARAGAHRGQRGHARRAGQPARAADDEHVAGGELRRVGAAARHARAARRRRSGRSRAAPGAPRGMPMSITSTSPACALPGLDPQPGLGAVERRGRDRTAPPRPSTSPVDASTPDGTSAATTGALARVDRLDHRVRRDRAARRSKPVPSSASTITCALSSRAGVERRPAAAPGSRLSCACASSPSPLGRPDGEHVDLAPGLRAAAARRRARRRRCCPCRRRSRSARRARAAATTRGEPLPRALHQLQRRDALRRRSPSGRSRASRSASSSGSSQRGRLTRATATAPAMPSRVGQRDRDRRRRARGARAGARRVSRTDGGSSPPPTTSTSCQLHVAQLRAPSRPPPWRRSGPRGAWPGARAWPRTRARRR